MKKIFQIILIISSIFYWGQCGQAQYSDHNLIPEFNSINNRISGMTGGDIIQIQSGTGDIIDVDSNGQMFLAGTSIPVYSAENPEIISSPEGKNCQLNAENQIDGYNSWALECIDINYYSVSVNVTGLTGQSLGLQLNQSETAYIQSNGRFTFSSLLAENSEYSIAVISMPLNPDQLCSISNSQGTIQSDIENISVFCASDVQYLTGSIQGQRSSVVLKNSNGELLSVGPGSSSFTFAEFLPDNSFFQITVENQPTGQECYILNNQGTIKNIPGPIEVICNDTIIINTKINLDKNLKESAVGKNLELWFYSHPDQIVFPLFKKTFTYNKSDTYKYNIPAGHYYIRGFIDLNNSSLPEMGTDYQSRVFNFGNPIANEINFFVIDIEDTTADARLSGFIAYIMNSQEWYQPSGGKCGGPHLRLEAYGFHGSKTQLSSFYVLTPDMKTVELLDDGGCGDSFSNLSSSYDSKKNDNIFTLGRDLSEGAAPGDYIFYFTNYYTGKITIIKDNLNQTTPLSSLVYLVKPNGEHPVTNPQNVLEWNPVAGAGSYEVLLESTDHLVNNFNDPLRFIRNNFYQPPFDLPDNSAFRIIIQAYDKDITESQYEFDLASQGPENYFITDFMGTNSITISGNLVNHSGSSGSFIIYADGNTDIHNWESSVFLPEDKNTYSLSVLKNGQSHGALISSLNIDQSGFLLSSANQPFTIWRNFLETDKDIVIDILWNKPLMLLTPENFERGLGSFPLLTWKKYESGDNKPQSYILRLNPRNTTASPVIIGMSENYFDFRYTGILSYLNLSDFFACVLNTSSSENGYCEILPESRLTGELDENTEWEWQVIAVSCNLDGVYDKYNKTDLENYSSCVRESFTNGKNITGESQKRIFSAYEVR